MRRKRLAHFVRAFASLALGVTFVGLIIGSAFAGGNEQPTSLFDTLACQPNESFVGAVGYAGLSHKEASEEAALGEFVRSEWPDALSLFENAKFSAATSQGRKTVISSDGRAAVILDGDSDGWVVEASLACQSFVRGYSSEVT